MSLILFSVFFIWNIVIFYLYYKKDYGVFQTPCLFSIVSLAFTVPQLYKIINLRENPDDYMSLSLLVLITCNMALTMGFSYGSKYPITQKEKACFIPNRVWVIAVFFAIIGIGATLMNRGVYKGGFISGIFVIINFFATYADYLLVLILITLYKRMHIPWFIYLLLAIIILLQIDKFIISARRGEAIQFILTISFFYFFVHPKEIYHKYKFIIPLFFIIGVLLNSQIGRYRENSYSGKVSVIENIKKLKVSDTNKLETLKNVETNNAIIGINSCYENGAYDYGTYNWNGLVQNFIPKSLVGTNLKESLMFANSNKALIRQLSKSGSTMTGYFDAFSSFGVFAFLKFLILGMFTGILWRKIKISIISLLLYVSSMSATLHTITHSTNNITSDLFFFILFIYPFVRICITKDEECN